MNGWRIFMLDKEILSFKTEKIGGSWFIDPVLNTVVIYGTDGVSYSNPRKEFIDTLAERGIQVTRDSESGKYLVDSRDSKKFEIFLQHRTVPGILKATTSRDGNLIEIDVSHLNEADKNKLMRAYKAEASQLSIDPEGINFASYNDGQKVLIMTKDKGYTALVNHAEDHAHIPPVPEHIKFLRKYGKMLGIGAGAIGIVGGAFYAGKASADEGGRPEEVAQAALNGGIDEGKKEFNEAVTPFRDAVATEGLGARAAVEAVKLIPGVGIVENVVAGQMNEAEKQGAIEQRDKLLDKFPKDEATLLSMAKNPNLPIDTQHIAEGLYLQASNNSFSKEYDAGRNMINGAVENLRRKDPELTPSTTQITAITAALQHPQAQRWDCSTNCVN